MMKIKIGSKKISEAEQKKSPDTLNKYQKKNLETLLYSNFEVTDANKSAYSGADDVAANFVESLYDIEFEKTGDFDIFDSDTIKAPALLKDIVQNVEPLKNSLITKCITGKSYGKIFKLSNDYILKIFVGGIDPEEDMRWYKKCYDMLHTGEARLTTLPVLKLGEFLALGQYKIWYVAMAEVVPLENHLKNTGRVAGDVILSKLQERFIQAYYNNKIHDRDQLIDWVKDRFFEDEMIEKNRSADDMEDGEEQDYTGSVYRPLTEEEGLSIINAFYDMVEMGFKLSDVATRNLGVLKNDLKTVVIFDR